MFGRVLFTGLGDVPMPLREGDGIVSNVRPKAFAAETDEDLTIAEVGGGLIIQGTTLTSDVEYTLPTAATLAVAIGFSQMDVGDAFSFVVTNAQEGAFDVVIVVNTGITAVGANNSLSVPPQSSRWFTLVKTAAATFDLY